MQIFSRNISAIVISHISSIIVFSIFSLYPSKVFSTPANEPYLLNLPEGVLEPIIPEENPLTKEKIELGKLLYFDKRLSADDTVSCATCHDPQKGFADGEMLAIGIKGQKGVRNSPTVVNTAFFDLQFWDGRASTLEEQAKQPLINPVEMGMPSHDAVVKKISKIPEYKTSFNSVFGSNKITIDQLAQAIASFERTLISFDSPFDRFISDDKNAVSESAARGWELFRGKARCITCHEFNMAYPFFTDNAFHNIGVAMKDNDFEAIAREAASSNVEPNVLSSKKGSSALGRYTVTKQSKDIGAFKTSGLRNIALTAPYMHDGSEPTLESVIDFYNKGGIPNPNLDGGIRPLNLTEAEKKDLVEFMKSLTGDTISELVSSPKP